MTLDLEIHRAEAQRLGEALIAAELNEADAMLSLDKATDKLHSLDLASGNVIPATLVKTRVSLR